MVEQMPIANGAADEVSALCSSPQTIDAFLATNGPKIDRAAVAITRRNFGFDQERIAQDIASKAMELLFRAVSDKSLAARISSAPTVLTWLHGVMRMMALEERKAQLKGDRYLQINEQLLEEASLYAADVHSRIDKPDVERHICDCFKTLSDSQRRVWAVMVSNQGDRPQSVEIANTLGMSVGSVDVHYKAGRERLKKCLESKGLTP